MTTTLVLLPGLDGTGVLFDRFVEALPPGVVPCVIAYPGDRELSYAELLAYILERVPAGPFAVLGESFSGALALRLAADPRVTSVILCASFVTKPVSYVPRAAAPFVFPFFFRFFPAFARAKTLLGGYSTAELRAMLTRAHNLVHPAVFAARARAILRLDARADLQQCRVPVMYLAGSRDGVVRAHNVDTVRRLRPDAEVVRVAAPHLVLQTAPVEAAAAVTAFLTRTAGVPV